MLWCPNLEMGLSEQTNLQWVEVPRGHLIVTKYGVLRGLQLKCRTFGDYS